MKQKRDNRNDDASDNESADYPWKSAGHHCGNFAYTNHPEIADASIQNASFALAVWDSTHSPLKMLMRSG